MDYYRLAYAHRPEPDATQARKCRLPGKQRVLRPCHSVYAA